MPKETKASDSSTKLEDRLDPLHDVALVIVHVNDHYGSVVCCKNPIKNILNARVASNVYEHVSHYQSFLGSEIGVKTQWKQRYIVSEKDGISYCVINNETDPGNYDLELKQRRVILVGGGVGNCHRRANDAISQILYDKLRTVRTREIHLPSDCICYTTEEGAEGESWLESGIIPNPTSLLNYETALQEQNRSYIMTVDGRVIAMDMSFEERTLHLAIWHNSADMISYLRNNDRLSSTGG